ncbi:MAG TPA: hypothetical protein DDY14_08700 [Chromatiaceae bacterium]|jgi:hypothetical protein|nr:MAG: hypothetical protein N838_04115 [Thiohalocapsa sp. PB-PSB1]QQO52850.1 MAG: hypothetical protein N838_05155 [Thiohalocapsa sp. PB-PSB1]HBG95384.1 hypothetical protein [Chromatiaceae bacterium]HCS90966.1 hypothetical protein [Chromatiaceae bacterium]
MPEFKSRIPFATFLAALGLCFGPMVATAATDEDRWHFRAVPYLWLPALDASADLTVISPRGIERGPLSVSAETSPDDYLSNLDIAFMLMGEARKGSWSLYTDLVYADFGNKATKIRGVAGPLSLDTSATPEQTSARQSGR